MKILQNTSFGVRKHCLVKDTLLNMTMMLKCRTDRSICFNCTDNPKNCIPLHWVCDGTADCTDKSDEKSCGKSSWMLSTSEKTLLLKRQHFTLFSVNVETA